VATSRQHRRAAGASSRRQPFVLTSPAARARAGSLLRDAFKKINQPARKLRKSISINHAQQIPTTHMTVQRGARLWRCAYPAEGLKALPALACD
jgi:hypothetical protein